MPELPEVETIVRELNASHLIGLKIHEAQVFWDRSIALPSVEDFCKQITGQAIVRISRRGKYIVLDLSRDTLLVHLRMTGRFTLSTEPLPISSHERVQLRFSDGRILHYEDQRKFGRWSLLSNPQTQFSHIGIEPLSAEFNLQTLKKILKKSSRAIKPFLLSQNHIAGLGNIYVDEALWESKIHPLRTVDSLMPSEISALYKAIPHVLKQGIAYMGTSLGSKQANYFSVSGRRGGNQTQLNVFRREGLLCPRCNEKIIKIIVAQRGTHLCPRCQRIGNE